MNNIATLPQVYEALGRLGYDAQLKDDSVAVKMGGQKHPFPAIVTHNAHSNQFQFTCMVAKLGEVPEKQVLPFALSALDANNRIAPFAWALISVDDDPTLSDAMKWPVVLVSSVPIGDFSEAELGSAMKSLLAALVDSRRVLEMFHVPVG